VVAKRRLTHAAAESHTAHLVFDLARAAARHARSHQTRSFQQRPPPTPPPAPARSTFGILYYTPSAPGPGSLPAPLSIPDPPTALEYWGGRQGGAAALAAGPHGPVMLTDRVPAMPNAVVNPSDLVTYHGSGPAVVPPSATM
jgi:hypothetical protein